MQIRQWAVVLGVGMAVVACGDDDDGGSQPAAQKAEVNKQAASQNAQSTIAALSATLDSGENGASVGALAGAAQGSQGLLQASPGTAGTRSVAFPLNIEGGVSPRDIGGPGCTCTGTSCTFTNCSFGATSGASSSSFTIDGSYSWGGGSVKCNNLKYTFSGSGLGAGASSGVPSGGISNDTVVTLNCDITITATSINGFVQSVGSSKIGFGDASYAVNWDVKTSYNNVTFGTNKTPTGGSLKVEGTTSSAAGGQSQNFAGSAEVTFP